MSRYKDELDFEIDRDMGWASDKDKPNLRRSPGYWQRLLHTTRKTSPLMQFVGRIIRGICKVVFFPIISPLAVKKRYDVSGDLVIEKRGWLWQVADGILVRLLLTPVILGLFMLGIVYATTHPANVQANMSPESLGMYYRRVAITASDGQHLVGWYIPPITAEEVVINRDGLLTQKWPGAVLAHGLGQTHEHYLPLARELNAAGFAVLLLDTRGQGDSETGAITFGLRERLDILAGVKFLRETPLVDGSKIIVAGHDIAATAALHAAALDSSISGIIAEGIWPNFSDKIGQSFETPKFPTRWLGGVYQATFELAMRERLSNLELEPVLRQLRRQPVLFVAQNAASQNGSASVQDVMALANTVPGSRDVVVVQHGQVKGGDFDGALKESRLRAFAVTTTNWTSPRQNTMGEIQRLFKNKVN